MGAMRAWYSCSSRNELRKTWETRMDSHHCRLPLDRVWHTPLSGHCSKVSLCGNLESCSRPWTWNADSPRLVALSILQWIVNIRLVLLARLTLIWYLACGSGSSHKYNCCPHPSAKI